MKNAKKEIPQPKTLEECFKLLNEILSDREVFKNTLENNAMAMAHHSIGRWIRNNWNLWWSTESAETEKPAIVSYFNETWGITHADDMSGIILQSYHRHLNNNDLGIEEQVKKYKAHWAEYDK